MQSTTKVPSERFSENSTWTTSLSQSEHLKKKLTKWITSDDEVKSQIPETDRSTKTFETEPQSSSILWLNWNVDTDSLIVCRGTEQDVPANITQTNVLLFVSAVFDPLGICSPFTIRMRFLLQSIWATMGQAWDKELSAEHSILFSDWCSDLRDIRTMWINRLYFENGCTNLRLHIFNDAPKEEMCIVAYLQDEATLQLTYIIGKCRVAPIRHMTIPKLELQAAVYGIRLRKHSQWAWCQNWKNISLDRFINGPTVATGTAQVTTSARCEQSSGNTGKFIDGSMETRQSCRKPCGIGTRGMSIEGLKESLWLNGPAWLQADEEKWPKPWCQVNEVEAKEATSK